MKFIYITIFLFLSLNAKAGLIDNSTITNTTASSVHQDNFINYGPNNVFDGIRNKEWATNGESADAWIEFNFSAPVLISEIWFSDRTYYRDNVIRFELIFTHDSTTKTQEVFSPGFDNTDIISINNGNGFYADYLRFTVLEAGEYISTANGYSIGQSATNVGAREFSFYSPSISSQVSEPSTLAIFALGIMGLASRRSLLLRISRIRSVA